MDNANTAALVAVALSAGLEFEEAWDLVQTIEPTGALHDVLKRVHAAAMSATLHDSNVIQ